MGEEAGHEAGSSRKWWTAKEESPLRDGVMDLDDSPSKSMLQGTNKGHQMKVSSLAIHSSNSESNTEEEIFKYWATEDVRKQNMKILHSATDSTLVEEALRYGSVSLWKGERVPGSSHLIPFFLIGLRRGSITIVQDLLGRGRIKIDGVCISEEQEMKGRNCKIPTSRCFQKSRGGKLTFFLIGNATKIY
ncbi:hypothetical protein CK203_064870 [Vitis vinifera]|uniref:Uncharacterized protein n=1 Tax=Vitis vinifera TaxID=29760 RepID=A0A438G485_VITVI|nr:hypothetical protein CK203_064870 [Vitis vinifera]